MKKTANAVLCMAVIFCMLFTMLAFPASAEDAWLPRVRIHLLGDSTVCSYSASSNASTDITGWGQALEAVLNDRVTVFNWAISGATTNSFLNSTASNYGRQWHTILKDVKQGDYVLIQFGHNDSNPNKYSAENPKNYGVTEEDYVKNLTTMVTDVRNMGAIPVLVTSPERKTHAQYSSASYDDTFNGFLSAVRNLAKQETVSLIDLNVWSKQKYAKLCGEDFRTDKNATGDIPALDAFFATDDITHFSSQGAISIAEYIADELVVLNAISSAYKMTEVAKSDIDYPRFYMNEDFEKANTTTPSEGKTNISLIGDRYGNAVSYTNGAAGERNSSIVTEESGNKALYMKSSAWSTQPYFSTSGTNEDYVVVELRVKISAYSSVKSTQQFALRFSDSSWNKMSDIYVSDTSGGISTNITSGSSTVTTSKLAALNSGEWNKLCYVFDQKNSKIHLLVNDKLVLTDASFVNAGGKLKHIYAGDGIKNTDLYLDDIRVYSTTAGKVAKMLLDGAESYLEDKEFAQVASRADYRIIDTGNSVGKAFYLPASAAAEADASFVWGSLNAGGSGASMTISNTAVGTTEPYYEINKFFAPVGYADRGDVDVYFAPTVKIGEETFTQKILVNVKRALLLNTDDTLEIGVPKFLNDAYCVTPNGTTSKTVKAAVDANTDGYIYTQTTVKNVGTKTRKFISAIAFYTGNKLTDVSTFAISGEIAPGAIWTCSPGVTRKANVETGSTAKFMIFDAETLQPVMNVISANSGVSE